MSKEAWEIDQEYHLIRDVIATALAEGVRLSRGELAGMLEQASKLELRAHRCLSAGEDERLRHGQILTLERIFDSALNKRDTIRAQEREEARKYNEELDRQERWGEIL